MIKDYFGIFLITVTTVLLLLISWYLKLYSGVWAAIIFQITASLAYMRYSTANTEKTRNN